MIYLRCPLYIVTFTSITNLRFIKTFNIVKSQFARGFDIDALTRRDSHD